MSSRYASFQWQQWCRVVFPVAPGYCSVLKGMLRDQLVILPVFLPFGQSLSEVSPKAAGKVSHPLLRSSWVLQQLKVLFPCKESLHMSWRKFSSLLKVCCRECKWLVHWADTMPRKAGKNGNTWAKYNAKRSCLIHTYMSHLWNPKQVLIVF